MSQLLYQLQTSKQVLSYFLLRLVFGGCWQNLATESSPQCVRSSSYFIAAFASDFNDYTQSRFQKHIEVIFWNHICWHCDGMDVVHQQFTVVLVFQLVLTVTSLWFIHSMSPPWKVLAGRLFQVRRVARSSSKSSKALVQIGANRFSALSSSKDIW